MLTQQFFKLQIIFDFDKNTTQKVGLETETTTTTSTRVSRFNDCATSTDITQKVLKCANLVYFLKVQIDILKRALKSAVTYYITLT